MKMLLAPIVRLSVLLWSLPLASAQTVEIAKVDYSRVGDLLQAVVLSQPENKELGDRFKASKRKKKNSRTKCKNPS